MARYVSKARLARAVQRLAAFGEQVHPHGVQHIIPLLALKEKGVGPNQEAQFEEHDDFRFWDRFFLVDDRSQTGRYYDPLLGVRCIATHPHSNVATARKGAFASAWRAGVYRIDAGRTLWQLADDYVRKVRERSLTHRGQTILIPTLDLIAWLRRHDTFRDGTTVQDLLLQFRNQFNLSAQEFSALFEPVSESGTGELSVLFEVPGTGAGFFGLQPLTPADVLELIRAPAAEAATPAAAEAGVGGQFTADPATVGAGLALPTDVVEQAIGALAGGSHLILAGPPGTGKSTLAENLGAEATRSHYASGYKTVTASADWTTFDTIGGYMPTRTGNELVFHEGVILRSIKEDNWCIIDELNRANADRAIGALLTLLAGSEQTAIVELPHRHVVGEGEEQHIAPVRIRRDVGQERSGVNRDSGDYVIGRNWRLVTTMNTLERSSLFPLTAALARRFATVYVGIPPADVALDVVGVVSQAARQAFQVVMAERDGQWTNPRPLGPAIVKDAWAYARRRLRDLDGRGEGSADLQAVAEALVLYVLPQYSGLEPGESEPLLDRLARTLGGHAPPGDQNAAIEALRQQLDATLRGIHGE